MSKAKPEPKKVLTPAELFAQAEALLDNALRFACLHYHHPPPPEEMERLRQRLIVLLVEDDYRRLRTYDQRAKLVTWLQTMANRCVSQFLRQEGRYTSLEDAQIEGSTQLPTQEELLLEKERAELLEKVLGKLTPHERKLFELLRQGQKPKEIARELRIKVESL